MFTMLTQNNSSDTEEYDRRWQKYKRKVAKGKIPASKVIKHRPEFWSGSLLKSKFRATFKRMWFDDLHADCLFRAVESRDGVWFQIILQYYVVPVEALLLLRMILLNKHPRPISIVCQRDYRRYQRLVGTTNNFDRRIYLHRLEAKIEKDGQPLVVGG